MTLHGVGKHAKMHKSVIKMSHQLTAGEGSVGGARGEMGPQCRRLDDFDARSGHFLASGSVEKSDFF